MENVSELSRWILDEEFLANTDRGPLLISLCREGAHWWSDGYGAGKCWFDAETGWQFQDGYSALPDFDANGESQREKDFDERIAKARPLSEAEVILANR